LATRNPVAATQADIPRAATVYALLLAELFAEKSDAIFGHRPGHRLDRVLIGKHFLSIFRQAASLASDRPRIVVEPGLFSTTC